MEDGVVGWALRCDGNDARAGLARVSLRELEPGSGWTSVVMLHASGIRNTQCGKDMSSISMKGIDARKDDMNPPEQHPPQHSTAPPTPSSTPP